MLRVQISRRPEPRGAEDIGTWYTILTIMSSVAVVSNSAIIAFTSEIFDDRTRMTRVRERESERESEWEAEEDIEKLEVIERERNSDD